MRGNVGWGAPVRLYLTSFLVVGLALSVLGPALTELRERSGSDIGDIGRLFVGQSLGYIAGSVVGGRALDRLNGHRVFALSLLVLGAGLALVSMVGGLAGLFVAFTIVGLGASVADLGANTLLMWELGSAGGRAMNLLHLSFGVGALAAPLSVHLGLDVATRIAALACCGLAMWARLSASPAAPRQARDEHTATTTRILVLLGAFFAIYVGLEIGFAGWIFTYGEEIAFSPLAATWLTTVFWIGFTLGRLLASVAAQRVAPARMLVASCSATLLAAIVLIIGDGRSAPVWIGTALMGLATAPQFPGMMNRAEERIHVTGNATRWFIGGAGVGGLVFPWLIGQWFDASGAAALPSAMLVFGAVTFASFAVANRALAR